MMETMIESTSNNSHNDDDDGSSNIQFKLTKMVLNRYNVRTVASTGTRFRCTVVKHAYWYVVI